VEWSRQFKNNSITTLSHTHHPLPYSGQPTPLNAQII